MALPWSASVIHKRGHTSLAGAHIDTEAATVPADHLVIDIEGDPLPSDIRINGYPERVIRDSGGKHAYLFLDATRSVGFHCIEVGGERLFFATEDAKLRLKGILEILAYLDREGLSWGRQLLFADGSGIRDSRIDYAWLATAVPEIIGAASEIAARPIRRRLRESVHEPPGGRRALVGPTLSLIRRAGRSVLDRHESGVVAFREERYSPRVVVAEHRVASIRTIANRRATSLLHLSHGLARSVFLDQDAPRYVRESVAVLDKQLLGALQLYPFAQLAGPSRNLPREPAAEEMADERYATAYRLFIELLEFAWNPSVRQVPRYAYVRYSDEIFQAFAAVVLSAAYGCRKIRSTLCPELSGPSFQSDQYDIYYDTQPPGLQFGSWRTGSSRPSQMQPDLTLVDRAHNTGLLMDAKYRTDGGRTSESALRECQVYMHSFQQRAMVVLYPGVAPRVEAVAGEGNAILEVAVGPFDGLARFLAEEVRPTIDGLLQPLKS